jgi:hypothetical protein
MKFLTDDPDWAPELYEARVLAMTFVSKHGRWQNDAVSFLVAERDGEGYLLSAPIAPDAHGRCLRRVG